MQFSFAGYISGSESSTVSSVSLKVAWTKLLSPVHLIHQKATAHLPRLDCHELYEVHVCLVLGRPDAFLVPDI